jgi:serine/threonine protein phosphatase 1
MSGRTLAIGDIHGCSKALRAILDELSPTAADTVVLLGDYVDRGPDSRGVIDQLVELKSRCNLVALRGNHEVMLLSVRLLGLPAEHWLQNGGQATLASYGGRLERIPQSHLDFLCSLRPFAETETSIFVHAGYVPTLAMAEHPEQALYWDHLPAIPPLPHVSGKTVFVGHTPQGSGRPLDVGHLVCLDTYCFGGLWLTAMDLESREIWQASHHGHLRRQPLRRLTQLAKKLWERHANKHHE